MGIEEIKHYLDIKKEVTLIKAEINSLYYPVKSPQLSSIGTKQPSTQGPTERSVSKIFELQKELQAKQVELNQITVEIEKWLETINDPYVRPCIRMHYLNGYTWRETTKTIFGDFYTPKYAQKIVNRYFEKVSPLSPSNTDKL